MASPTGTSATAYAVYDRTTSRWGLLTMILGLLFSYAGPVYLLLFSAAYVLVSIRRPAAFSEDLDRVDALYFTMTVFATVGFGDIAPVTQAARVVVTIQMVANLVVLTLLLRLVTRAVRINRGRRATADRHE